MPKEETGHKIRVIREQHNMTLEALGHRIGKSKQWLSELERGNIRLTYDMAITISKVFGSTPDIFLSPKSKKNSPKTEIDEQAATRPA